MSPAYQNFGPRDVVPPPFYSRGGSFLVLILPAEQTQLQTLVDTMLNEPAKGQVSYTVPGKWVAMQVGTYVALGSRASGYASAGMASETSVAFWVPLLGKQGAATDYVALNAPFVYVDQPMSLSSGREVFGYPKSLGRFTPELWNGSGIEMYAFGGMYFQNSHATWSPLIKLLPATTTAGVAGPVQAALEEETPTQVAEVIFRGANAIPDTVAGLGGELWETVKRFVAMLEGTMRQAFLKQFRDVAGSTGACYQKVIEANGTVISPRVSLSDTTWRVQLSQQSNHPIAAELGLAPVIETKLGFTISMDIELLPGTVVAPLP